MTSLSISQPRNYSGKIGRIGLTGNGDMIYDKIHSDAEKTILEVVTESGGQKFGQVAIEYRLFDRNTLYTTCEINPEGKPTTQNILVAGNKLLEDTYGVYQKYPEVVRAALRFGIEHELSHRTGSYSSVDKILKKYVESGKLVIVRTPNGETNKFILTATPAFSRLEFDHEREYKANLQAMTSRLKEPEMTFEKMEDEVAAMIWLIAESRYKSDPFQNIGDVERACSDYLEKKFPRLGEEFKEQITEKIFEIDREYRRRCKEMTDHTIGHNI